MKHKFYAITVSYPQKPETLVTVEPYTFDSDDPADKVVASPFLKENETLEKDFALACYRFMTIDVVGYLDKHSNEHLILTEQQFDAVQAFKKT